MGIHRMIICAFAGAAGCGCMLFVAPAAGAIGLGASLPPVPPGDPSPFIADPLLPALTLAPAASAGTQVTVPGGGLAICLAANGDIKLSRDGTVSLVAVGDGHLRLDGIDPVPIAHLNEEFAFLAGLGIAGSVPPGGHQVASRCVDADGDTGSPDLPVPPPPDLGVAIPGGGPAAGGTAPVRPSVQSDAESPGQEGDATLAASRDPGRGSTAVNPSPQPDARAPAENSVNRALLPGADPVPLGPLVAVLVLIGILLVVPALVPVVRQARRGPKWVRTNVRAVADVTPVAAVALTPQIDDYWPATPVVRFALHADSGTQAVREVAQ